MTRPSSRAGPSSGSRKRPREKQARIDTRRRRDRRRQQVQARRTKTPMDVARDRQHGRARRADRAAGADPQHARRGAVQRALAALDRGRARRQGQPPRRSRSTPCARAPPSARSRRALEEVWGRHRADDAARVAACTARSSRRTACGTTLKADIDAFADGRGTAAAHPGRQARPGRPRSRRQGGRDARSPTSASTSTSARCSRRRRKRRARRSRTTCTSSASRRSPPATRRWCRRSIDALRAQGAADIVVFVGGVVPPQDYAMLEGAGVAGIYGPGTAIPAAPPTCWRRSAPRTWPP